MRILKQKQLFSKTGQESIDSSMRLYEEYPYGFSLEFGVNGDKNVFDDVLRVINMAGNKR